MADALREHAAGTLVAPPRFSLSVPEGRSCSPPARRSTAGRWGFASTTPSAPAPITRGPWPSTTARPARLDSAPATPSAVSERAVRGADAVLRATDGERSVFDPDWLAPGAHVASVGPAFADAHELPPAVADRADAVVTDSLAQVEAYREEGREFLVAPERLVELSALVAGDARRERGEALTLFCSVGFDGTEVALADAVLDRADGT